MSAPIKNCRPLFEALLYYQGEHNVGVIPKYRLDIVLAGMILTEEKGSFIEQDVTEKLKKWGYDTEVTGYLGRLKTHFTKLIEDKVFVRNASEKYEFNNGLLKK